MFLKRWIGLIMKSQVPKKYQLLRASDPCFWSFYFKRYIKTRDLYHIWKFLAILMRSVSSVVFFFRRMFSVDELCMFLTHKRRPSKLSLQKILLRLRSLNGIQIGSNRMFFLNWKIQKKQTQKKVFTLVSWGLLIPVQYPASRISKY